MHLQALLMCPQHQLQCCRAMVAKVLHGHFRTGYEEWL